MLTATKCLNRGLRSTMCTRRFRHLGGLFVNFLTEFGRTWQVYVEAEAPYARTRRPWAVLCAQQSRTGMCRFPRSQLETRTARIHLRYKETGRRRSSAAPRRVIALRQATAATGRCLQANMPHEMGFDYMGMSYQEQKAAKGFRMGHLWPLRCSSYPGVGRACMRLVASWSVLLSTSRRGVWGPRRALAAPVVLGWFLPPYMVQMDDVYTQIWSGEFCSSVWVPEFNSDRRVPPKRSPNAAGLWSTPPWTERGFGPAPHDDALAFIVGCVPLWTASGAGAIARQFIGTTVIGGMVAETFIGRFLFRRSSM